jgi:GNAT superfamily N-acetyltransferase
VTETEPSGRANAGPDAVAIRPFDDGDYDAHIAIDKAIDPDEEGSVEALRFDDAQWRRDRYFKLRVVATAPDGRVVGWGQVSHMPWQFRPELYRVSLAVHPAQQRRGIGSALYEHLLSVARERGAVGLRADTQESRANAVAFLAHRGFGEIQRYWESRLDVAGFDAAAFATAPQRAADQGITLTTLAAELAAGADREATLRAVYALEQAAFADVPFPDPPTSIDFDEWRGWVLDAPGALPDAFFLAKDGGTYAGLSTMNRNAAQPEVLYQGFTGVLREYRGKGVAMALKLLTVRYAREQGYREIRTGNNTRNRPMLRINEAMGFRKQPVWIEYEKAL